MDGKYKALLDRMMVLCSKREYCESDIRKKLSQAMAKDDGEPDIASDIRAADEIIIALKKDRFLDDRRYAEAFARDKSSISGWGKVKIRHALAAKGIGRPLIEEILSGIDGNPGMEKLEKALKKKYSSLRDDPQCKLKLLRFALGRGYEYDEVRDMVDAVIAAEAAPEMS